MSDIDFITDLTDGRFRITLGDNPQKISGNRALVNRFEITFLTKTRHFLLGEDLVIDNYGGDAEKFINRPQILNDLQGIAASISVAVDQTVDSMKNDQPASLPDTEKIDSAELVELNIIDGIIASSIQIYPVEIEEYSVLMFNLPIIRI